MELIKVLIIFVIILAILNRKVPLYIGMGIGAVLVVLLFQLGLAETGRTIVKTMTSMDMWSVVFAMYAICALQAGLDRRKMFDHALDGMNGLLNDARVNAAVASACIGMMPGPATVTISGKMIETVAGDHLKKTEKAATATIFRHIPEMMVPTFPGVIMACGLSGIAPGSFFLYMIPLAIAFLIIGFFFYLRKVPKTGTVREGSRVKCVVTVFRSLWTLLLSIVVIVIFNFPTWIVVAVVTVINVLVERYSGEEVKNLIIKGFDTNTILGIFATYIFKDLLVLGGVIDVLPEYFSKLPIPAFLIIALIYYFGTLVAGSSAAAGAFIPLAFAMIPEGGPLLLAMLMAISYAASEISPTHICIAIVSEYFDENLLAVTAKIFPVTMAFVAVILAYYAALSGIL